MIENKRIEGHKGFTLMEVLIVIVIMGVLAGLAVPMYKSSVEKSRKAEALAGLGAVRQSELRQFAQNGSYTTNLTLLDYDPNSTEGGQTRHFSYAITSASATAFVATATRNSTNGGDGSSTVTINQAGVIGGTF